MFFDDELHYYLTEEDFYDDPFCDENGVLKIISVSLIPKI
jgi:cell filamentation protein